MSSYTKIINSYTRNPLPHSNIFVGSIQLLFWFGLRPSVWRKYIETFDPSLDKSLFSLNPLIWQEKLVQRLLIQILILVPMLMGALIFGGLSINLNTTDAWPRLLGTMAICSFGSTAVAVAFGLSSSMMFSISLSSLGFLAVTLKTILNSVKGEASVLIFIIGIGVSVGLLVGLLNEFINTSRVKIVADVMAVMDIVIGLSMSIFLLVQIWRSSNDLQLSGVSAILMGLGYFIGLWAKWLRPTFMAMLLVPWHDFIYHFDEFKMDSSLHLLSKHIAFWDEWQYLPIPRLDKHLLLVLEKNPIEGQAALNYLSTSRQRWAAQVAQIELDARQLESCNDVQSIAQIQRILTISELVSPADTIYRSFSSISADVDAAFGQSSIYYQRLNFTSARDRINSFIQELTISSDKYAVRFRPIAQKWKNIIDLHIEELIKLYELRQEIESPYIIGVPITDRQQLFVGRISTSERLEKLLIDRLSPPLLLYGQRRTGKTSLLNNLGRLLPRSIVPLFIDLQGPVTSAIDHTGFLYNFAKGMINSANKQRRITLPPLTRKTLADDPFSRFDEWLDSLEIALGDNTALLALDEFEVLDRVLNEGRFNEADVLGMLRNLIQHRPKFKVLLAGSHTLSEFQRWSSYLINAQVIHLGYLQESEARELIERPIENFALRYEPPASQRVIDITRGHPFLVQLLCAEIVVLKNNQDPSIRRLATLPDIEAAISEALQSGSMFFSDIECNQLDAPAVAVLRYCAQQGEAAIISKSALEQQFSARLEGSIDLLLRRELIETRPSGYSIQLELIRRWFI
jgi:hypothetical protein